MFKVLSIMGKVTIKNTKNNAPIRALAKDDDTTVKPGQEKEVERDNFEHFIESGDAEVIETEDGGEPDKEPETEGVGLILRDLPHVEDVEIDLIIDEYGPHLPTIQEEITQDFLEDIDGIGPSKAEDIMEVIDELDEEVPERFQETDEEE